MSLTEFMEEEKKVSRWLITKVFLAGAFAGAVLAVLIAYLGLL